MLGSNEKWRGTRAPAGGELNIRPRPSALGLLTGFLAARPAYKAATPRTPLSGRGPRAEGRGPRGEGRGPLLYHAPPPRVARHTPLHGARVRREPAAHLAERVELAGELLVARAPLVDAAGGRAARGRPHAPDVGHRRASATRPAPGAGDERVLVLREIVVP